VKNSTASVKEDSVLYFIQSFPRNKGNGFVIRLVDKRYSNHACVFGDFNPKNVGIKSTTGDVYFIDTDTYQLLAKGYEDCRCIVACDGYVAPELLHRVARFKRNNSNCKDNLYSAMPLPTFTKETDLFALGIYIFQLLMNGYHPYSGVILRPGRSNASPGTGNAPIEQDFYVFKQGISLSQNTGILPLDSFPPEIGQLFTRCFIDGTRNPAARPSAKEWYDALKRYEDGLTQCQNNPLHQYYVIKGGAFALKRDCPYCEKELQTITKQNENSTRIKQSPQPVPPSPPVPNSQRPFGIRILSAAALLLIGREFRGGIVGAAVGAITGMFQQPHFSLVPLCVFIGVIWGGIAEGKKIIANANLNSLGKYQIIGMAVMTIVVLQGAFSSAWNYYSPELQQHNPVPIEASSDPSGTPVPKVLSIFEVAEKGSVQDLRERLGDGMGIVAREDGDIHMRDAQGATLLHRAARRNKNVDVIKYLVSSGADIHTNDREYGATPLHWAAENGNIDVAKYLVSNGANIHTTDVKYGATPLHWAAENENIDIAKYLVSQGANVNAKNKSGMTPLDYAKQVGNTAMVEFLSNRDIFEVAEKGTVQDLRGDAVI
jgi:serine/threonine protein kinase